MEKRNRTNDSKMDGKGKKKKNQENKMTVAWRKIGRTTKEHKDEKGTWTKK